MNKIFISYTLKDKNISKDFLEKFQKYILNQGMECYVDLLDNDYNEEGFQEKLVGVLKECNLFLAIDTFNYLNSKWTKKELKVAESLNLRIIRIKIDLLKEIVEKEFDFSQILNSYR